MVPYKVDDLTNTMVRKIRLIFFSMYNKIIINKNGFRIAFPHHNIFFFILL